MAHNTSFSLSLSSEDEESTLAAKALYTEIMGMINDKLKTIQSPVSVSFSVRAQDYRCKCCKSCASKSCASKSCASKS